jgi:GAF domain-containing protein
MRVTPMADNQETSTQSWRKLFSPPQLADEAQMRDARILHTALLILIAATIATYFTTLSTDNPLGVLAVVTGLLAVELASFILLRLGKTRLSAWLLASGLWLTLLVISPIAAGLSNAPFIALVIVIVVAGLLLGGRAGTLFALLSTLAGFVLLMIETNRRLPEPTIPFNLTAFWVSISVIFFAVAGLISIAMRNLKEALERAQASEMAQFKSLQELQKVRDSLEEQITERTRTMKQRSGYLQASFEVSRAATSILDTDRLIQEVVDLIRDQFGLYYVGLFLVDDSGEWAVLRAGTGQAGRIMLARAHRIKVGSGMIGWSIANVQPRLALEAGEDPQRLATLELPETRSEAAIPLFSRDRVLGALSVQSQRPDAFGETEIAAFQAMADQIAIALDNARLFSESQAALAEAQRAYGEISQRAWREFLQQGMNVGYRYENQNIISLNPGDSSGQNQDKLEEQYSPEMRHALRDGEPWQVIANGKPTLYLPIPVRDQVVGVINVAKQDMERGWSEEEIALLKTIVEQLGVALDSARLYQDTQRLALREQLTGEVTARIRETLDIETVLRTAVQEVQRTLGVPEVLISLSAAPAGDALSHGNGNVYPDTEHDGHKS